MEDADVRQVAVPLGEIEAVADHEPVRDLEPDVPHRHVDLAARLPLRAQVLQTGEEFHARVVSRQPGFRAPSIYSSPGREVYP